MPGRSIHTFFAVFSTVLISLVAIQVQAQQLPLELTWRTGSVILTSGDTIMGNVILMLPSDLLRVTQADGTVSAFSAVNVSSFEVQDNENRKGLFLGSGKEATFNFRRKYISLPWNHDKDYSSFKSPAFFILLHSGKYTLLMRENRDRISDPAYSVYNSGSRTTRDIIKQQFYLLTPDQNIIRLSDPKKDILRIFSIQQKELTAYAKENKLSFTEATELSQIVAYANSLTP